MVTAVFGSGSLKTARLKKALPSSGMSEKSIALSLRASILAQFVRDRFLVVGFFMVICLICDFKASATLKTMQSFCGEEPYRDRTLLEDSSTAWLKCRVQVRDQWQSLLLYRACP